MPSVTPQEQWVTIEDMTTNKLKKYNVVTLQAMCTHFGQAWTHLPNKGLKKTYIPLLISYRISS